MIKAIEVCFVINLLTKIKNKKSFYFLLHLRDSNTLNNSLKIDKVNNKIIDK